VVASQPPLILGSASPRRSELLTQLALDFDVATVDIDERQLVCTGDARGSVAAIAAAKFTAFGDDLMADRLLTADTLVAYGDQIMGKPDSDHDLQSMLRQMANRAITIVTAVCVGSPGHEPNVAVVETIVTLRELSEHEISSYVATGAGRDKAGGLALQAEAGPFIAEVDGCWSNVLGLPLCAVVAGLATPIESPGSRCSVELCGTAG